MASKEVNLRPFQATPFEDIQSKYDRLRATYRSGKTKDVQFRLQQLRKFYWAITDLEPLILAAVYKDLRKCYHEAVMTEVAWCKGEALDLINGLEKWLKDETVVGVPATFWAMKHRVHYEPLGTVLVIGAFNYPFQLTLLPFLGAVAAGNTVMVKPSELSAFSAMVIERVIEYMDPDCYACVNGAVPVSQAVLDLKWNKIAFTGGKQIGKIIAKKAAETLTPTLLELGGQNPAFITKNANVKLAARRLLWGKTTNAGQVCLSHNYALVERSVLSQFIGELNNQYRVFMPKGAKESPDYCRIVNKSNFDRIRKMLDDSKGKIVMGGKFDETDLYIEPTVVIVDDIEDSMITQESFGPIWSVVPYDNLDSAIDFANEVDPTPLALFAFGNDQETSKITNAVTSGGATVNDAFTHASVHCAPFGGVGESGNGTYHGFYSIKAFSHARTIARVPNWIEKLLRVRYMPYQAGDLKRLQAMNRKSINFDRQGNVNKGLGYWLALVLGLGGSGVKGAAVRWGILFALAYAFQLKRKSLGL